MKKLILISLIFLAGCSSTKTISINSKTILNKNERVDWAITRNDSIIDFRKKGKRYAEIIGDKIFFQYGKDSTKTYSLSEFKTVHTFERAPEIPSMIFGVIVASVIIFTYLVGGINVGG